MIVTRVIATLLLTAFAAGFAVADESSYAVSVEYHKLDNGLKVVLSPNTTVPLVTVMLYYNIGFRIEREFCPAYCVFVIWM